MKNIPKVDLAEIFTKIEKAAGAMDDVAGQILQAAREASAKDLEAFNLMIYAAYDKKGWSSRIGRPMEGDVPAPRSIKTYISAIRAAYKYGVKVLDMKAISELRKALADAKAKHVPPPALNPPKELVGVKVAKAGHLTGGLFHDVIVLWENLPEAEQAKLEAAVRKAFDKFSKKAPPALKLAA